MKLHNLKPADTHAVNKWLIDKLNLGPYQKEKLHKDEIVRYAPFQFFEQKKKVNSKWMRLTLIPYCIIYLLILISLPFKYFITGRWGYAYEKIKWFDNWQYKLGL